MDPFTLISGTILIGAGALALILIKIQQLLDEWAARHHAKCAESWAVMQPEILAMLLVDP